MKAETYSASYSLRMMILFLVLYRADLCPLSLPSLLLFL